MGLFQSTGKRANPFNWYRPKGVFRKGVGNSKNASEMRQKCVKMGLVLLGKEERSKMRQKWVKIASKMRQKCAEHLWRRTPFGRYRLKERGAKGTQNGGRNLVHV